MRLLPGMAAHTVQTARLRSNVVTRADRPEAGVPLILIHDSVSSSLFWQPLMISLPPAVDAVAVDLRGFGDSQVAPVDAGRGLRDFSDDVAEVVAELGVGPVHLVGWSMGGGVAMQYALDHPALSLTLINPVSPFGFGGTHGVDGQLSEPAGVGSGGGCANPQFIAALAAGDRGAESPTSPRSVYASAYVKPGFSSEHDDLWVESMLTTATGVDNYPGDSAPSRAWPGFAPGRRGVLNTLAPTNLDLSGIVDLKPKPPILWIRGADDLIVSDTSHFDLNFLGQVGAVPGWPGVEVAPPQPMVSQTRAVFDRYAARGGTYRELTLPDCGHSPHLEYPEQVRAALLGHLGLERQAGR
jgi:pimeloyl-ACP methyl ester carboxylesterase